MQSKLTIAIILTLIYLAYAQQRKLTIYTGKFGNGRYLAQEGNTPFFWAADTAWLLSHSLTLDEASLYLADRAQKGFNTIQTVAVWSGATQPNVIGEYAFSPNHTDPTQPNPKFWNYVDRMLDLITQKGFYIGLWPVWGSTYISNGAGSHPTPYPIFNNENAYIFGKFIGSRYKSYTNIVWVLGGDIQLPVVPADKISIYRALAEGIAEGYVGGPRPQWNNNSDPVWRKLLMSLHPQSGLSSSETFNQDAWLRFNLIQSGWLQWQKIVPLIERDYRLSPVKPTFMGEGAYEWAPYNYCNMPNNSNDQWGVRFNAYWSTFAGGFGYTYGANGIWQFGPNWKLDLNFPASAQLVHLKNLYESHEFTKLVPDLDNSFIPASSSGNVTDCGLVIGTYAMDGTFAFVYDTKGIPFSVNLAKLSSVLNAYWMSPITGARTFIGNFDNSGLKQFTPPTNGMENDWVLILQSNLRYPKKPMNN